MDIFDNEIFQTLVAQTPAAHALRVSIYRRSVLGHATQSILQIHSSPTGPVDVYLFCLSIFQQVGLLPIA
jgi:hypothetical protein